MAAFGKRHLLIVVQMVAETLQLTRGDYILFRFRCAFAVFYYTADFSNLL